MKSFNFISGLPRAGSTLLSSILSQNPRFTSGISDPLYSYVKSLIRDTQASVGMSSVVPEERLLDLMRDLFMSFYKEGSEVCFNTNRFWTADTELLKLLFSNFKMIVMVRDVARVVNSFELLHLKNPLTIKPIFNHIETVSPYQRAQILMEAGYVSAPIEYLKTSFASRYPENILYVEYGTLAQNPKETMQAIYEFLDEPWFEHDFDNVEKTYDEYDEQTKINGLHTVRQKVEYKEQPKVLPEDLWQSLKQHSIWNTMDTSHLNWLKVY